MAVTGTEPRPWGRAVRKPRDLKELFPYRGGLGSHAVKVRKGTPDNDGEAVGPGQIFKIFVSKTKNEGVVGDGSHVSLGFVKDRRYGRGTFGKHQWGRIEMGSPILRGPEVTRRYSFQRATMI